MATNEQTNFTKIEMGSGNTSDPIMTSKMNNNTHKVIIAKYTAYQYWAVPIDWKVEDCSIRYDNLFHKDDCVEGVRCDDIDYKYPDGDLDEAELDDYAMFFDCEENSDDDECVTNPPYYCDGGCGKQVGDGNDHDCKRVCDDCE